MASVYVQAKGKLVHRGPHCTVHYDPDKQGMARCAVGKELRGEVLKLAKKAKKYAVSISPPRSHGKKKKVHYRDSFLVKPGKVYDIGTPEKMVRVSARLMNVSPQAKIVEVGTDRSEKYAVLKKTLDHLNNANPVRQ